MWKCKELPNQERLKEVLDYDMISGLFTWRKNRRSGLIGKKAGSKDSGYLPIRVDGTHYLAHRLAWVWMTGDDPQSLSIDHINRDGMDNSWNNLRLADAFTQGSNKGRRDVQFRKKLNKWIARCQYRGIRHYLGVYQIEEEAIAAVEAKRQELLCG